MGASEMMNHVSIRIARQPKDKYKNTISRYSTTSPIFQDHIAMCDSAERFKQKQFFILVYSRGDQPRGLVVRAPDY